MDRESRYDQERDLRSDLSQESKKFMDALEKGANWNELKQIREKIRLLSALLKEQSNPQDKG